MNELTKSANGRKIQGVQNLQKSLDAALKMCEKQLVYYKRLNDFYQEWLEQHRNAKVHLCINPGLQFSAEMVHQLQHRKRRLEKHRGKNQTKLANPNKVLG